MKTVTTTITGLFILFFTGRLVAQPVNTATNKIKPGYWYTTQDAQPTGVAVGTTGAAQVWDYSNLVAIPLSVGFDSMSLIGSFTVPSVFTGANTMFHSRNTSSGPTDTSYNFTIQVGDTLRNMGYYTPDNTFMQRLINPISLYPYYPFTYNDSLIDSTRTVYIGAFSSDTTWQYIKQKVTGYGTLLLPGNRTYTNVLQIKRNIKEVDTGGDSSQNEFIYYLSTNIPFPLLEVSPFQGTVEFVRYMTSFSAIPSGPRYTFTGSGNWSAPSNWQDNLVPPGNPAPGSTITITPSVNGVCVINVPYTVPATCQFIVSAGARLQLPGNLVIQ